MYHSYCDLLFIVIYCSMSITFAGLLILITKTAISQDTRNVNFASIIVVRLSSTCLFAVIDYSIYSWRASVRL